MTSTWRVAATFVLAIIVTSSCGSDGSSNLFDVPLLTVDGRTTSLDEYVDGEPVVVALWAEWCQPCRRELPELDAISRDDPGVGVLAVNIGDEVTRVESFLDELGVELSVALDVEGRLLEVLDAASLPATFIVDDSGNVVWKKLGTVTPGEVAAAIESLG